MSCTDYDFVCNVGFFRCQQPEDVMARELVPGDVVLIKSGDRIPADCRLVHAADLFVDESRCNDSSSKRPLALHDSTNTHRLTPRPISANAVLTMEANRLAVSVAKSSYGLVPRRVTLQYNMMPINRLFKRSAGVTRHLTRTFASRRPTRNLSNGDVMFALLAMGAVLWYFIHAV